MSSNQGQGQNQGNKTKSLSMIRLENEKRLSEVCKVERITVNYEL